MSERHGLPVSQRTLGSPILFAITYSALTSAVYFSLGVIAQYALGLTPLVFFLGGVFYVLCAMTYVEGASMHAERGGSTVFARHAFNELWSFITSWAILLDCLILVAVCAFAASNYLAVFWAPLGRGAVELFVSLGVVALVTLANIAGPTVGRYGRVLLLALADLGLQLVVIVVGLASVFNLSALTDSISFGSSPTWDKLLFALPLTALAFTGLESAAGLSGEVRASRRALRRLVGASTVTVFVVYVGVALVALTALPVRNGTTELAGAAMDAPLIGVVRAFRPQWLGDALSYAVGAGAALLLVVAANSAMLALSRQAYSLATNRQIPAGLGRLHPTRATPYVAILIGAALAAALVLPLDLNFLVGIYAFGAMLAFTVAHVSVCVLRYREPERDRPYRIPLSVRVGRGLLPLPAVLGAVLAGVGWLSVVAFHDGARYVGLGWTAGGLVLYVAYRLVEDKPLLRRVTVPERALRREPQRVEYGSILVPLTGTELDDDLIQTAGRLASEEPEDQDDIEGGAVIEALWIIEVPMSLPIDARLPENQLVTARHALGRAKAIGEEYEGVTVATATARARRRGQAIVDEARRRGVEAIVLAAEEPSRVRGGALLGGLAGGRENFVGEETKYVVTKAPCRVILTAPPAREAAGQDADRRLAASAAEPRAGDDGGPGGGGLGSLGRADAGR